MTKVITYKVGHIIIITPQITETVDSLGMACIKTLICNHDEILFYYCNQVYLMHSAQSI